MVDFSRGDTVLCDLNPVVGTEQAGVRPAVILQIDRANAVSPHTIIVPFTSKIRIWVTTSTDETTNSPKLLKYTIVGSIWFSSRPLLMNLHSSGQ